MNFLYRAAADAIWLLHFFVVFIALFGWLIPSLRHVYIMVLVGTLISELALSYCILSKWELELRKKVDSSIEYDFSYASYYTYRLTQGLLRPQFLRWTGIVFISFSLAIQAYFLFL